MADRSKREGSSMDKKFRFSNIHTDFQARDAKSCSVGATQPPHHLQGGKGMKLIDMDNNEYYDMSSGMMCMVLGHSHPELTEVIREMAGTFLHQSSWYSNPWTVEFAERLGETCPGQAQGGELRRHRLGSQRDRHAHGARLHRQVRHRVDGARPARRQPRGGGADQRRRQPAQGPRAAAAPAKSNALQPPYCYRCPVNLTYPSCDIACQKFSEEMLEFTTSQNIAGIMVETIPVPGGMIVPPPEWLPRLAAMAKRWGALLILDECQLAPARTGKMWAMEHYGVTPDIVTWGKGLSAGLAICGTITTEEIAEQHARQRRPAMGRHLLQRPDGFGRRAEAARHRHP